MADLLDTFYWNRRSRRCLVHDSWPKWQNDAHGWNASLLSSSAFRRPFVSEFSFFRLCSADRKRTYQSYGCDTFTKKEEKWGYTRRDLWHNPDALDLYSVLYVSAELHVHDLFCVWTLPGHNRLCSMGTAQAGRVKKSEWTLLMKRKRDDLYRL